MYSTDQLELDNNKQCNHTTSNLMVIKEERKSFKENNTQGEDEDTPVQIIIVSLWYWWYVK